MKDSVVPLGCFEDLVVRRLILPRQKYRVSEGWEAMLSGSAYTKSGRGLLLMCEGGGVMMMRRSRRNEVCECEE